MDHQGEPRGATDMRQSHRASLLLRRAKIVCQSGEYLTLIRDVSENGVGLGFLHDVPPEPRVLLQLANDVTYPIERVWTEKRQAGYRFGCTVNLDEFLGERTPHAARPIRLNVPGTARIQDARTVLDARLLDLSCDGAKIACPGSIRESGLITFELTGLPPQLAQVHWAEGGRYGIGFQHPLDTEELALCALHLQPFGRERPSGFAKLLAKARAA
jgi:hypothetical protein